MNRLKYLLVFSLLFTIISCGKNIPTHVELSELEGTMSLLMQEGIDNSYKSIPGISLAIRSPKLKNAYAGVQGFDSTKKNEKLTVNQPFRIASITKTFVATSILKLHENGLLDIYEPISKYISKEHVSILESDNYNPGEIQIYHCLTHTSGLFDYAMNGSDYVSMVKQTPQRRWTRTEQLQLAIDFGDPAGQPGERYLYCDTGYILLGEIIEYFHEGDLANGLRELIGFEKLGMNHTWLESLEPEPSNMLPQVKRYFGKEEFSSFDASSDLYGGGGLVSTCNDLSIFLQALFNGKIFAKKSTLDLMLSQHKFDSSYDSEKDPRFKDYRMGLWKVSLYGDDTYMHSGLWGTTMIHIPSKNSSYAINFTRGWSNRTLKKAVLLVNNID